MIVTVTSPVRHLCPYVDEVDDGTAAISWHSEAPELHGVRLYLEAFASVKITHEALTQKIVDDLDAAAVTTWWSTAGMEIEVDAVPSDESV